MQAESRVPRVGAIIHVGVNGSHNCKWESAQESKGFRIVDGNLHGS